MTAWRTPLLLSLFSAGLLAAEPVASPEAEFSLELLEFLGEYGKDDGELALPEDFDAALTDSDRPELPVDAPAGDPSANDKASGNSSKPATEPVRVSKTAVESSR